MAIRGVSCKGDLTGLVTHLSPGCVPPEWGVLAAYETLDFLECSSHRMVSFLGAQWQRLILEGKKAKESNLCVYSASKGMDSGSRRGAEEVAGTGLAELTPYPHSNVILEGHFSPSVACPFP